MPFISKAKLEELRVLAAQAEKLKAREEEIEQSLKREYQKYQKAVQRDADDRVEELTDTHKIVVKNIKKQHEAAIEKAESEVEAAKKAQAKAEERTAVLEGLVTQEAELIRRENEVDKRDLNIALKEAALEESTEFLDTYSESLKKQSKIFQSELADAKTEAYEAGHKKGYAEGASDAARKMVDLNKEANDKVFKLAEAVVNKETPAPVVNTLAIPTSVPQTQAKK